MKILVRFVDGTYLGEEIEGDLTVNYEFNGSHQTHRHIKLKLGQVTLFDLGPFQVRAHAQGRSGDFSLFVTLSIGQLSGHELRIPICQPLTTSHSESFPKHLHDQPVRAEVLANASRPTRGGSPSTWLSALARILKKCAVFASNFLKEVDRRCARALSSFAKAMKNSCQQILSLA